MAENILSPMKAIRAKCLDCCCGQYREVELCPCSDCPLYPYRFGRNPNIKRKVTPEQLAALEKARLSKKLMAQNGEKSHDTAGEGTDTTQPLDAEDHGVDGEVRA